MSPQDQNDKQDLHPLQAKKLETMFTANPNAPQMPPPQAMPPAQPVAAIPQARSKKKLVIAIIAGVTVLLLAVVAAVIMQVASRNDQAAEFERQANSLVRELSTQVSNMKTDFDDTKELKGFEESKQRLKTHTESLEATKSAINSLEEQYQALPSSESSVSVKQKIDEAFVLAKEIVEEYEEFVAFQLHALDAYGQLPHEITAYLSKYQQGGLRSEFVNQTAALAVLAVEAKTAMSEVDAPEGLEPIIELRLENLAVSEETFRLLKQYYETGNDGAVEPQLQQYGQKGEQFNQALQQAFETYATDSELAQKFATFLKTYPAPEASSQ